MEENNLQEDVTTEQADAVDEGVNEKAPTFSIGVQFRPAGKIYTFATHDRELVRGDRVIVEGVEGECVAEIACPSSEMGTGELPANASMILRRASAEDIESFEQLREKAVECFTTAAERIRDRQLPMKLIDVDVTDAGKKAVFIFFAENRVDFRALVKDLAGLLHMRIEMRQIGARDEAKIHGCMGPCGQTTCCSTHLRQFQSISISMAKHQGLAPNPAKLTGMCGKLKCCLAYEQAAYDECRRGMLKVGAPVETAKGTGKIVGANILKRECTVRLYAGGEVRLPSDECRKLTPEERDTALTAARKAKEEGEERSRRRGRRDDRKNTKHVKSAELKEGSDDKQEKQ
jgi:cell fate regulator YaaT (PSP1 superfamily)